MKQGVECEVGTRGEVDSIPAPRDWSTLSIENGKLGIFFCLNVFIWVETYAYRGFLREGAEITLPPFLTEDFLGV